MDKSRYNQNGDILSQITTIGAHLTPHCEELEPKPPVVGPQKVCSDTEDLYELQCIQEVQRQQIERSCGVEHLSSGAAHFALCDRKREWQRSGSVSACGRPVCGTCSTALLPPLNGKTDGC